MVVTAEAVGGGEGVPVGVASMVPMTMGDPLAVIFTIICLPSGVVTTCWPPAVVDI